MTPLPKRTLEWILKVKYSQGRRQKIFQRVAKKKDRKLAKNTEK